jgi:SAM-dependent methyltransferase
MDPRWTPGYANEGGEPIVAAPRRSKYGKGPVFKSLVTQTAGYDQQDLAGLPTDAVEGASGCGTPVAFSDLLPGEVVLDLGSGAGLDLLLAAKKVGPEGRIIGVDPDEILIERTRSNIASVGLDNVEVRRGCIEELPVADRSVDWVISNLGISPCADKAKAFAEIHRVLKPGGRVCLADIVAEGLPDWIRSCESAGTHSSCGAMSEHAYIAGLADAGLADIRAGGRYVFEKSQLLEIAGLAGCGEGIEYAATDFAKDAVGGVWSSYFFARKTIEISARPAT